MYDMTAFQRDLLYVIAGLEEPHGLEIKRELETYYGEDVNQGQLYPNLDALHERDLVNKGKKDQRTNYYGLTEVGIEAIMSRRMWENMYLVKPFERGYEGDWADGVATTSDRDD